MAGLVALIALACVAAPAQAESPADFLYEPTTFTEVRLTVPPASIKVLEEGNPKDKYQEAEFALAETNGVPNSAGPFTAPIKVGIKIKGHLGSGRKFSEKAAFKIKFDKVVEGQRFDGLEKMTLNNMVQDPSMIHEATTYSAFHDLGVPSPNVGYSYLTINGASYGLHLNIETQDPDSLEKQFGPFLVPPQHLYEGEYGADVTTSKYESIEVAEGDAEHIEDLEKLVTAFNESSPSFAQRVGPYADLGEMTRDWIGEKYTGHWDGYSGTGSPNNYYLYSSATGVFQMMPSGTDQTWQSNKKLEFDEYGGALFNSCLADTAGCRQTYIAAGEEALAKLTALKLDTVARCTSAAVRPWREYEIQVSDPKRLPNSSEGQAPYGLNVSLEEVAATRAFIAGRPAELASFLEVPAPAKETGEPACPPLRPIGGFPPPAAPPPMPAPPASKPAPASTTLRLGRANVSGKRIVVHLTASGPGTVVAVGTYGFDGKKRRACTGRTGVDAAGAATVTCKLTTGFRRRLEMRPLKVGLTANFTPAAGAATSASRTLRLRRG